MTLAPASRPEPGPTAGRTWIPAREAAGTGDRPLDLSRAELPPVQRPRARLAVLDVTEFFGETSGGVKTYLLEKERYVAARSALRQVLVVPGARDALVERDGVRWYHLHGPRIPTQRPYRFMLATRTTRKIIRHERPDVVEVGSHFMVPWIVHGAARPLGVPLVWFYHSNLPRVVCHLPEHAGRLRRQGAELAWGYVRRLSRLFLATLVTSDFSRRDLERAGVENVVHVPLGVDLDRFHPRRRARAAETRRALGLPEGPLALYLGRMAREKHLGPLLAAWPEVERRTGAHLVLVGDGPSRRYYQRRVRARRVIWRPYETDRERLADLHAAVDLYISPCPIETFGLAALEAFASGTPVLTPDQGGVAERVRASGAGGLYPVGAVAELAETAIRLLQGDPAALGARGRSFAERHHSWDLVFDRIFDTYARLLGR
ncbi:MAG TPA: glycosyltransferase [Gemmatimonadales bacterium]|nr:glycosyltransferase [Gemmatimonadales bacterium]